MVVGDDSVLSNLLRATVVQSLSAAVGLNSLTLSGSNGDEYHLVTMLSVPDNQVRPESPFANQVVVFTGKLSSLGRREACELVQRLGGQVTSDVTSRTTMLVVGAEGFGRTKSSRFLDVDSAQVTEKSNKLKLAETANAKSPDSINIITEEVFCKLSGVPSSVALRQKLYSVREIRARYSNLREDHLRYLEKCQLVHTVARTNTDRYYGFRDLALVKKVSVDLERKVAFRVIVRSLVAEREGQLTFDFQGKLNTHSQPAKVVTLTKRPLQSAPDAAVGRVDSSSMQSQTVLAARYFTEGARLDEGNTVDKEKACKAYRQALMLDPNLVPALVNLANLHYAQDKFIESQAIYERAINLDPDCFEAYFNLGNIHHDLGRFTEANTCYQAAVRLNPDYADTHFYLAVTLEQLGRSQDAKPHWQAYRTLAPTGEWFELALEFSE